MSGSTAADVAYSGFKPAPTPQTSIFDFVFSNPFQHATEIVPESQTVPRIDDATPIFVDNKTSTPNQSLLKHHNSD